MPSSTASLAARSSPPRTLAFLLALLPMFCSAAPPPEAPPAPAPVAGQVYDWLVHQQDATGLLGNQEGDPFSGVYSVALAALCFVHQGDLERAERVFDFFARHLEQEFAEGTPGGFRQFWDAAEGTVHEHTDRWLGDNAWLLIALNDYRRRTGNQRYDAMRKRLAEWILGLQDEDGGIFSGFNKDGPMTSKSTEANLDCYTALVDYPEPRARILGWLRERMWVPEEHRFRMGSTVDESALDCASWAVSALGREYAEALAYAEEHFLRTDTSAANGALVTGFADFIDKQRVWLEGTGEMVVAYRVAGRPEEAGRYLAELEKAMVPSRRFEGTRGLPCSTSDPSWEGADKNIFVPAQAWYLFGHWRFNPMAPPP